MASIKSIVTVLLVSTALVVLLAWWMESQDAATPQVLLDEDTTVDINGPLTAQEQEVVNPEVTSDMNPTAVITTNRGVIELELFEDQMPITVANFVALAESDFYNNTKFHRVINGFMIQGGDPNTKGDNEALYGQGGPEANVQDEFVAGELLTNTRGTISMANTGQPNSGGSQFFINLTDNSFLDFDKQPLTSKHPVFGRVTAGLDVVDTVAVVETKAGDIPVEPVVVSSINIVRN